MQREFAIKRHLSFTLLTISISGARTSLPPLSSRIWIRRNNMDRRMPSLKPGTQAQRRITHNMAVGGMSAIRFRPRRADISILQPNLAVSMETMAVHKPVPPAAATEAPQWGDMAHPKAEVDLAAASRVLTLNGISPRMARASTMDLVAFNRNGRSPKSNTWIVRPCSRNRQSYGRDFPSCLLHLRVTASPSHTPVCFPGPNLMSGFDFSILFSFLAKPPSYNLPSI